MTNELSAATEYVGRQGLADNAAQKNDIKQAVSKVETFIKIQFLCLHPKQYSGRKK